MGLGIDGFVPETLGSIQERVKSKLEIQNPGFDFSPEAPDGQFLAILGFEIAQAWNELDLVYNSYNPNNAVGAGLRNLGLITGIPYGTATRSRATVDLTGTAGTVVPKGSLVTDSEGNEFATVLDAVIPSSVQVFAVLSGAIPVPANSITSIKSVVSGWSGVDNPSAGTVGSAPQTEEAFRNTRNQTVLRNFNSVTNVMQARLFELGIEQAVVLNNDHPTDPLSDGTPAQTIHVTVGEVGSVSDEDIAKTILYTKGLACPTYGTTTVNVTDDQGAVHEINFSKATGVDVFVNMEVTFLSVEIAGAEEAIKAALVTHINGLLAGEDVIWSRLFQFITPYAKAQVDLLEIGGTALTTTASNFAIASDEFAQTQTAFINITVNS